MGWGTEHHLCSASIKIKKVKTEERKKCINIFWTFIIFKMIFFKSNSKHGGFEKATRNLSGYPHWVCCVFLLIGVGVKGCDMDIAVFLNLKAYSMGEVRFYWLSTSQSQDSLQSTPGPKFAPSDWSRNWPVGLRYCVHGMGSEELLWLVNGSHVLKIDTCKMACI